MAGANEKDSRVKQVAVVAAILLSLMTLVSGALIGWHYIPGIWGEWIGLMVGVMSTPFFLEASFLLIGLMIVLLINHWRQKRAGDELVDLESLEPQAKSGSATDTSQD